MYDGERMVGTAVLWSLLLDNTDKAFFDLCVDPPERRRGIGRALVQRLEQAVRSARSASRRGRSRSNASANSAHVDRVGEQRDAVRVGHRARSSTPARACPRRAPRQPRRTGGTTAPFTARRQPGRASRSLLSTRSTYGTPRARHHAAAACEANVLQPETTTTSGSASSRARGRCRARSGSRGGARDTGPARAALQEDGPVLRLDRPRPALHGAPRVEHRQVELRARRDTVEHHRAERRRLGDDERQADGFVSRARAASPRPRALPACRVPPPQPPPRRVRQRPDRAERGRARRRRSVVPRHASGRAPMPPPAVPRRPVRSLERVTRARRGLGRLVSPFPGSSGSRPGAPGELGAASGSEARRREPDLAEAQPAAGTPAAAPPAVATPGPRACGRAPARSATLSPSATFSRRAHRS